MRALAVKAEDRFRSMEDFLDGLSGKKQVAFHRARALPTGPIAKNSGKKPQLWIRLRQSPTGLRIAVLVLCIVAVGLGVWGTVAGIRTSTGRKTESDAESSGLALQKPNSADNIPLREYTQDYLNITMGIPEGYTETESGNGAFISADGTSTLQVGFYDKSAGFPVYTLSDVEKNAEKYVRYYIGLLKSTVITEQKITDRGYRKIDTLNVYLIQFAATESGGTTMEFLAAFIECQNGFGCYNIIGSYPQGDEAAEAEIFAAMDSFRSSGPAGTIYQRFYDERLPFQFLYMAYEGEVQFNVVNENRLEISNSDISMEVQCHPLDGTLNKGIWLDRFKEEMSGMSGAELRGGRWKRESGGIDWMIDGYTITEDGQTVYIDVHAGESDGFLFIVLVAEKNEDNLFNGMLLDVANTIRPVE